MKESIKSVINEAFGGRLPLNLIKKIVATIIVMFFIVVCSAADSIGPFWVAFWIAVCAILWKFLGISKAFAED